ncbi:MAG: YigZ family protein, partial [Clostridia bacterium]
YRSAAGPAVYEEIRKRSRFIAYVEPVDTPEQAEAMLARIREQHPGATHVCYAYRAGWPAAVVRMSDDGEPQGTAGRPILDVLERQGVDNTCIAVVRYFGGTLLGAAGLVRAYAAAAAEGLARAGIAEYRLHACLSVRVDYARHGRVERLLEELGARVVSARFTDTVELVVAVPREAAEALEERLADATAGAAAVARAGERYLPAAGDGSKAAGRERSGGQPQL